MCAELAVRLKSRNRRWVSEAEQKYCPGGADGGEHHSDGVTAFAAVEQPGRATGAGIRVPLIIAQKQAAVVAGPGL
jgi:hypothetical protein